MPATSLVSSVLWLSAKLPREELRQQLEFDWLATESSLAKELVQKRSRYQVVILDVSSNIEFQRIKSLLPQAFWILTETQRYNNSELIDLFNLFHPEAICEGDDSQICTSVQAALSKWRSREQGLQLGRMIEENNHQIQKINSQLEWTIQQRELELETSKEKLAVAARREKILLECLTGIGSSTSVGEIENQISGILQIQFAEIPFIRISLEGMPPLFGEPMTGSLFSKKYTLLNGALRFGNFLVFSLINSFDDALFEKVAQSISLSLVRLGRLSEATRLHQEWEATFDSISAPVALINDSYEPIQTNLSFRKNLDKSESTGKKCFEILFQRSAPCENCRLGEKFLLKKEPSTVEVTSHKLNFLESGKSVFVHIYHDITEQLKMEQDLLNSSKLAELGTIGSSIAHELNNPVGGILNFAQLIKMDLAKNDPIYDDVAEIEQGALRCRDIIQNLLSFTREADLERVKTFDFRELLQRVVKLAELKARWTGIRIQLRMPEQLVNIEGHPTLISQALQAILQYRLDRLRGHLGNTATTHSLTLQQTSQSSQQTFPLAASSGIREKLQNFGSTELHVTLSTEPNLHQLIIDFEEPESDSPEPTRGSHDLSLTTAVKIINDHGGKWLPNFLHLEGHRICHRLTLPRET